MSTKKTIPSFYKLQNYNIYRKNREINVWKIALGEHYKRNPHHPEHFAENSEMSDLNKKHMLCDLLGNYLGNEWKWQPNLEIGITHAAAYCRNLPNWKYVKDYYAGSFAKDAIAHYRWPSFMSEEPEFIKWMKCLFTDKVTMEEFVMGLYSFTSVEHYRTDLQWHQYAVEYVGKELFPNDKELLNLLEGHDKDKWDGYMLAAYVLKYVFKKETIELDRKFKNSCMDEFIYNVIEKGTIIYNNMEEKKKSKQ